MFEAFKAAGALAGLMKNKEGLKAAGERLKARLGEIRAAGSAGGGAVRVTVDGKMKVHEVRIDPVLARHAFGENGDPAMAESLIAEAVNDAMRIAQTMAQREVAKEGEALGLPGLPGLDSLLGGP